jgi:hypothetical protein
MNWSLRPLIRFRWPHRYSPKRTLPPIAPQLLSVRHQTDKIIAIDTILQERRRTIAHPETKPRALNEVDIPSLLGVPF